MTWRTSGIEDFRAWMREDMRLCLYAFFDESGKFADSSFFCLGGFVAHGQLWDEFSRRWRAALNRHNLKALHTSKINWQNNEEVESLSDFAREIRRSVNFLGFIVSVDASYFRSVAPERRALLGGKRATDFVFHRLLRIVRDKLHELGMDNSLAITFDYEDGFSQECLVSMIRLRKEREFIRSMSNSIGFADDEDYFPLQAADLFVFGRRRALQNDPPQFWRELAKGGTIDDPGFPCMVEHYDRTELESAIEQIKQGRVSFNG